MSEDKGLAAVVILYNPDMKELLRHIHTYLPYLAILYVFDNSVDSTDNAGYFDQYPGRVIYVKNPENRGIAWPLNHAAELARAAGFTWLLTMDQDSGWSDTEAERYFSFCKHHLFNDNRIAVVGPSFESPPEKGRTEKVIDVTTVITSGSLIQLTIHRQCGGFDERLFIDEVDHEYCYRMLKAGYRVVQLPFIHMNHQLGTKTSAGYLKIAGKRSRILHSPTRLYYMIRNYLLVRKLYRESFPEEFRKRDREVVTSIKNNLLFSGRFLAASRQVINGYLDYKKNRFSQPS